LPLLSIKWAKSVNFPEKYHPALILMDIRMPLMDGYETIQQLKKNPSTDDIPIIALTASVTLEDKSKIKSHGFDGYLSKQVKTSALFNEISHYLQHIKLAEPETQAVTATIETPNQEQIVEISVLRQTLEEKMLPVWEREKTKRRDTVF
jgi:CheY-like chemotaxis protein